MAGTLRNLRSDAVRYASRFLAERAVWPDGWEQVKATAVVLAREAERHAYVASNDAGSNLQPVYPLLVHDLAEALGYYQDTEVPF